MIVRATRDASYEAWRNSKIPLAEAKADGRHPAPTDGATQRELAAYEDAWNAEFHRAMGQLTSDPFTLAKSAVN
jgi:hypothetical protein